MTDPLRNASEPHFRMIDITRKRPTYRRAVATGRIVMQETAYTALRDKRLAKGDALALAEVAGIMAAKNTSATLPLCHPLVLDAVQVHFALDDATCCVHAYAQVCAYAKTGVEMEALISIHAALLCVWDLSKSLDPGMLIKDVRLLAKTGGKSDVWTHPEGIPAWLAAQLPKRRFLEGVRACILVMSDRAAQGVYTDESGALLKDCLEKAGADISAYKVIPDDKEGIALHLKDFSSRYKPALLLASGGTGPGPRDVTPDVLKELADRQLDGLGDLLRAESLHYAPTAWLSRMSAAMIGPCLVITLPGSPQAVMQCWSILTPFLGDALRKIKKQGYA